MRSLSIEHYTTGAILKLLQDYDKVNHVDFVSGGRVVLFFTDREYEEARVDYAAAQRAGMDMHGVEWLTREQTHSVRVKSIYLIHIL